MKNVLLTSLAVLTLSVAAIAGGNDKNATKTYKIDDTASKIKWVGKKVTGEHTGTVKFKAGTVAYNGKQVTGGNAVVDMNTITCTDLAPNAGGDKLVGHLKAEDFFNTAKFATAEFKLTSLTPIAGAKKGESNYKVKGTLIIKGISNPIEFPAIVGVNGKLLTINGDVAFDRTKYDIKFGSASFFESLGDKAIYDEVLFSLALVARAE